MASQDATYEWSEETATTPWQREVALPGRVYEAVPPREIEAAVSNALDRIAPDAVAAMTYSTPDAWAAIRWAREHRRVAIMMSETRAEDAPRVGWREAVKRQLAQQYDAALVGGASHRAYAEQLGLPAGAIHTPYDVVDNAYFAGEADTAPEAYPGLLDRAPFFLASGRFVQRKNFDGLLAAYARYRREAEANGQRPWRLLLLGDGALRPELEAQAGNGVEFCGFQQREALPGYYGRAGAFVHPSHMDQWGLVVNEAMAASLPVLVSTGAGCAPELVRDGVTGWTFHPADLDQLASLLGRVASMSEEARRTMGAHARAHVGLFSPEAFGDALGRAAEAGRARADRGLGFGARAALAVLRTASRRVGAFHSIEE